MVRGSSSGRIRQRSGYDNFLDSGPLLIVVLVQILVVSFEVVCPTWRGGLDVVKTSFTLPLVLNKKLCWFYFWQIQVLFCLFL